MLLATVIALELPLAADSGELEQRVEELERRLDRLDERASPPGMSERLERFFSRQGPGRGMFNFDTDRFRPRRAWLGVELGELTAEEAKEAGVRWGEGVAIRRVVPGSPADRAGLREGDVILNVDGERVGFASEVAEGVGSHEPGEEVTIGISRNGVRTKIGVALGEQDAPGGGIGAVTGAPKSPASVSVDTSGLHLSGDLARRMKLTEDEREKVETVLEEARRELVDELARAVNEGGVIAFGELNAKSARLERDVERKLSQFLKPEQVEEYRRSRKTPVRLELKAED